MSEAGTATPESDAPDQRDDTPKLKVLMVLLALGSLGIILFWAYRTFASIRKNADEVGAVFGLFAPPKRKSRLSRIAGKG
jgi:hypothetical protein